MPCHLGKWGGALLVAEEDAYEGLRIYYAFEQARLEGGIIVTLGASETIDYLGKAMAGSMPPRLLLVDLDMQDDGGFKVLSWVRQQPSCAQLPVVIWSSSYRDRRLDLGGCEYIRKDTEPRGLLTILYSLHNRYLAQPWVDLPALQGAAAVRRDLAAWLPER